MAFRIQLLRDYHLYGQARRTDLDPDVVALCAHVVEHVSAHLNSLPMPACRLPPEVIAAIRETEPDLPIPLLDAPGSDIDIDLVLATDPEVYEAASLADDTDPDGCEGFFAVHADAFEGSPYATRFRVFWRADHARLLAFLREDAVTQADVLRCAEAWLATIPHELCHVIDWIANTGGLTPADVDLLESHGALSIADALLGAHDDIDAMEEHVENTAKEIMATFTMPADPVFRLAAGAGVLGSAGVGSMADSNQGAPHE